MHDGMILILILIMMMMIIIIIIIIMPCMLFSKVLYGLHYSQWCSIEIRKDKKESRRQHGGSQSPSEI